MTVAIVGSRHYRPKALIEHIVIGLEARHPDSLTIVSGAEPTGVDDTVEEVCRERGYHFCMSDPDGITHLPLPRHMAAIAPENGSARAKFARNSKVVQHVSRVIALFANGPMSPGTSDTVAKARKAGLPVNVHHEGKWL